MTVLNQTCVLKFGSSVIQSPQSLPDVVTEIYRWYRQGRRVVAVVSAMGDTTDRLLEQAESFADAPDPYATAALLATGELTSAALLGLALDRAGVPGCVLDHRQIGLRTDDCANDASPAGLDVKAIEAAFKRARVLIVPGFLGIDDEGHTTLLGRGGSDLTAIYIAHKLNAERCRLIKDVDGLYESDPNEPGAHPRRYERVTYDDALALDGAILQKKATVFAKRVGKPFEVGTLHERGATLVGAGDTLLTETNGAPRPLRVALLGLGTVGRGVYDRLIAQPQRFDVVSIAVRDIAGPRHADIPRELLTTSPTSVFNAEPEVVIELIGGIDAAHEVIEEAIARGCHVVTANKALDAVHGAQFRHEAHDSGATFRASAGVGGATPMIEHVRQLRRLGEIESIEGVLNGSTNAIIDDLHAGLSLDEAITSAQRASFCEADPSRDLEGLDAADKLIVLARTAFGRTLRHSDIDIIAIDGTLAADIAGSESDRGVVRHIARCRIEHGRLIATIEPSWCSTADSAASVKREWNVLTVRLAGGRTHTVRGRGAGRVPTTESVLADVLQLRRSAITDTAASPSPRHTHTDTEPALLSA